LLRLIAENEGEEQLAPPFLFSSVRLFLWTSEQLALACGLPCAHSFNGPNSEPLLLPACSGSLRQGSRSTLRSRCTLLFFCAPDLRTHSGGFIKLDQTRAKLFTSRRASKLL
jgi:hypothetical protein